MLRLKTSGFTLVEMLVTISIIGVLFGITFPALQGAVRIRDKTLCQKNLATIGQFYSLYANEHEDLWPNIAKPLDQGPVTILWGSNGYDLSNVDQIDFWAWPLRDFVGGVGGDTAQGYEGFIPGSAPSSNLLLAQEMFSCPVIKRKYDEEFARHGSGFIVPAVTAEASYLHSAALFTQAGPWTDPQANPDVNLIMARVRHANVAHPSQKAALVETRTHHGHTSTHIKDAPNGRVNILACDGHVEMRRADESTEPVLFTSTTILSWKDAAIPYVSTEKGYLGVDW